MDRNKLIAIGLGLMVGLLLLAFGLNALDHAGWLPHRQDTAVYVGQGAWPADEMRRCSALPKQDGSIFFLGCGDTNGSGTLDSPVVPVTFWGRTERPDRFTALHSDALEGWRWQCRKSGQRITCYAVN